MEAVERLPAEKEAEKEEEPEDKEAVGSRPILERTRPNVASIRSSRALSLVLDADHDDGLVAAAVVLGSKEESFCSSTGRY